MLNKTLKLKLENLKELEPITKNQEKVFKYYADGYNLCLSGSAGSGKTFLALYLALQDVLDKNTPFDKVVIIRSVVPTREIGFLPGDEEEKLDAYAGPYRGITSELFSDSEAWQKLINQNAVEFMSTSFIRGITISNAIVIVDEMQNLNFHELDSVITRLGECSKLIICGDYYQSDFEKQKDKDGVIHFLNIVQQMKYFEHVEFSWEDIVRSGLVREYIMTKEQLVNSGQIQKI
jgi:predicted ribonuclease YlaK